MLACFADDKQTSTPIFVVGKEQYPNWLAKQSSHVQAWLRSSGFRIEGGSFTLLPDEAGNVSAVVAVTGDIQSPWSVGHLPLLLPPGYYRIEASQENSQMYALGWGLGAYQFTRYKQPLRDAARLCLSGKDESYINNMIGASYMIRDWTNTPTDDMGPSEFARVAKQLAKEFDAEITEIVGDELIKQNYASIYTVGRASDDPPRLLDLRWGKPTHPKVTLVGKGVCFDSGGLDIKSSSYMLLMKKDMAGGAHVFGLARMIMSAKLPIRLRVLVPLVENVISGNAYRPGDVIKSRKGLTIEVGNTDAEGRLILADALTEAVSENPELLIDISTLTGAARVALGTELPAVFSNNDSFVHDVIRFGESQYDPMWRLPLYGLYRDYINSAIADINNNSSEPYAGAITAALFLKEFVPDSVPWLHIDMMAWNLRAHPGRPQGAEAMTVRALFSYLKDRYTA